jgi:hypothetical protein
MRGYDIIFFVVIFNLAIGIFNEINNQYFLDYDRYLVAHYLTPQINMSEYDYRTLNDTMDEYGVNIIPPGLQASPYLFSGGNLINSVKMMWDRLIYPTLGFGHFLQRTFFPSMLDSIAWAIDALMWICYILLVFGFVRGYYFR